MLNHFISSSRKLGNNSVCFLNFLNLSVFYSKEHSNYLYRLQNKSNVHSKEINITLKAKVFSVQSVLMKSYVCKLTKIEIKIKKEFRIHH